MNIDTDSPKISSTYYFIPYQTELRTDHLRDCPPRWVSELPNSVSTSPTRLDVQPVQDGRFFLHLKKCETTSTGTKSATNMMLTTLEKRRQRLTNDLREAALDRLVKGDFRNCPPSRGKGKKKFVFIWYCCRCRTGPIGIKNERCPRCQRLRCVDCNLEKVFK